MKVHKVELFIIDNDFVGAEDIKDMLENTKYPNYCIVPQVKSIKTRDIGEWSDDHPLNKKGTAEAVYNELFENK